MKANRFSRLAANLFGSAAYFMLAMQWLWLLSTTLLPIMISEGYRDLILPEPTNNVTTPASLDLAIPESLQIIIVVVSILFAVIVSLYALYLVPRAVSRAGHNSVQKVATITVEQTTRHHKIKPRQKQRLAARYTWLFKFLATALPLAAAMLPIYQTINIEHHLVAIVAAFLASLSLACFGLQLLIAYITKVPIKSLW